MTLTQFPKDDMAFWPVTMQARAFLEERVKTQCVTTPELNLEQHCEIQRLVESDFEHLCGTDTNARLFGQMYSQLMSSILAFDYMTRAVVSGDSSENLIACGCPPEVGDQARRDQDIRSWAWRRTLLDHSIMEADPCEPSAMGAPSVRSVEACMTTLLRIRSLALRGMRTYREAVLNRKASVRVLVVAPAGKRWLFERYGVPGARCVFVTPEELSKRFGIAVNQVDPGFHLCLGAASDAVNCFVTKMGVKNEPQVDFAVADMKSSFDILLTCAEDDPLVRCALERFGRAGKPAWIFPEGAVPLNEKSWPFYRMFHYSPKGVNRIVFCELEGQFWSRQKRVSGRLEKLGYMADSTAGTLAEDYLVRSWWALHRRLTPSARRRTPVFLSYEVLEDFGMTRLGLPSESDMLRAMDQAVVALTNAGHYVLVKARSDLVAGIAAERYRHLPVFVTSKLPWQSLARLAGGLIAHQSSLVFEAQYLGLHAVVWNPTHLPSRAEDLANEFPNGVTVAYTDRALVDATREMTAPLWSRRVQRRALGELRETIGKWALRLGEST